MKARFDRFLNWFFNEDQPCLVAERYPSCGSGPRRRLDYMSLLKF